MKLINRYHLQFLLICIPAWTLPWGHEESDTDLENEQQQKLTLHIIVKVAFCLQINILITNTQRGSPYNYCYYCHSIDEETEAQDREVIFQGLSSSADCT